MTLSTIVLLFGVTAMGSPQTMNPLSGELVHVTNAFRFEIAAPQVRVALLFGPEAARGWAGNRWNPEFLYPRMLLIRRWMLRIRERRSRTRNGMSG